MENSNETSVSHPEPGGNTKNPRLSNQSYRWIATWHNEEITLSQLSQHLKLFCKEFYGQLEMGEITKKLHWQFCFSLKTKERLSTLKNHFSNNIHLEPTKDWFKAISYCTKKETRVEGPFDHTKDPIWTINFNSFYPWQKNIWNIINVPNPPENSRRIHWYWDPDGSKGKTAFCKWATVNIPKTIVLNNGGIKDIAHIISKIGQPNVVLFNFTRQNEERINYAAIEAIKDGIIMSGKYDSTMLVFNSPHIVCFANIPPDTEQMSLDRWDIQLI